MNTFLEAVGFGLVTSAIVALAAVGLTLTVSVTNFINFAYGDVMTFGAYVVFTADAAGLNFFLAVIIGGIATAAFLVLANLSIFRPLARRGARGFTLLISTIGLSFILQNAISIIWGTGPHRYSVTLGQAFNLGPFLLSPGEVALIGTAFGLLLALHLVLQYTTFGKSLRATSNNSDLAQACGIDVSRVITWTWVLGGFFAAVAGVGLVLETNTLRPTVGFNELFIVFGAVILGGIGRVYGAMLGALAVGLITEIAGMYISGAYKTSIAFGIVVLLLLLRPQGLFSARSRFA